MNTFSWLVKEELRRGELKYQTLANNIGLLSEMNDLLQGCKTFPDSASVMENMGDHSLTLPVAYLSSASGDKFDVAGVWGESPPQEKVFDRDACWGLRRGRPYMVESASASLMCQHLPQDLSAGYQCWPIEAQGDILGLFHLRKTRLNGASPEINAERTKEVTQQLLTTVVDQIAMILINLKLRKAAQA